MGFFSDLKEDLNQAVNELMPDGQETEIPDDEETLKQLEELEQMLKNIEMPAPDAGAAPEESGPDKSLLDWEPLGKKRDNQAAETLQGSNVEEVPAENGQEQDLVLEPEMLSEMDEVIEGSMTDEPADDLALTLEEPVPELTISVDETVVEPAISIMVSADETTDVPADNNAETEDELQSTVGEFQNAVEALKDSVDEAITRTEPVKAEKEEKDLEEELRATFGASEGEETVEDYLQEEAIRTGASIIDKSWVLDLKGMETMDETAIITSGMRIKGDILSNGSADVIGEVMGNVQVKGKLNVTGRITGNSKADEIFADAARINGDMISDSTVKIGVGCVVIGNIEATSAVIAGAVKGTIDVNGPVILDATAVVLGNIRAKSMQINNGARIEGMCVLCYAEQSAAKFFEEQSEM